MKDFEKKISVNNRDIKLQPTIKTIPKSYPDFIMKQIQKLRQSIIEYGTTDKTILIINSGAGSLPIAIVEGCKDLHHLIIHNEDPKGLEIAKNSIDRLNNPYPISYITNLKETNFSSEDKDYSLNDVDICIDFASNIQRLKSQNVDEVIELLKTFKKNVFLVGLYFIIKSFDTMNRIDEQERIFYTSRYFKNNLKKAGYENVIWDELFTVNEPIFITPEFNQQDKVTICSYQFVKKN